MKSRGKPAAKKKKKTRKKKRKETGEGQRARERDHTFEIDFPNKRRAHHPAFYSYYPSYPPYPRDIENCKHASPRVPSLPLAASTLHPRSYSLTARIDSDKNVTSAVDRGSDKGPSLPPALPPLLERADSVVSRPAMNDRGQPLFSRPSISMTQPDLGRTIPCLWGGSSDSQPRRRVIVSVRVSRSPRITECIGTRDDRAR